MHENLNIRISFEKTNDPYSLGYIREMLVTVGETELQYTAVLP